MATLDPHLMGPTDDDSELPSIWRSPLLSDSDIDAKGGTLGRGENDEFEDGARWVRDQYEAKITSGELIVASEINKDVWVAIGENGIHCKAKPITSTAKAWVAITKDEYDSLVAHGARIVSK